MRKLTPWLFSCIALAAGLTGCQHFDDIIDDLEPAKPHDKVITSELSAPLGLEMGDHNRLWVTENGTGINEGRVSLVMPGGKTYPAIVGFATQLNPEGEPGGLNHLVYKDGMLYILSEAEGRLYMADVSDFRPNSSPMNASDLDYQGISTFIVDYDFGDQDSGESNPYNLTFGPEGDLFIVDAAANAVIRRDSPTGDLSVFAFFPEIPNPMFPIGPETIDVVPTGIVWDGERFLVSSLTGFPFPTGAASIYEIDREGNVSVYQDGFTMLVDIALGPHGLPVVLQFTEFSLENGGFQPNMGRAILAAGNKQTILKDQLNLPTAIVPNGPMAYVTSLADGSISRIVW